MFRRNFIKTLTLSALPTSFSSVSRAALPYDCDLLIVGSGAAGLSAAISASESGLKKVLLLEKMPVIGGISGNSGGAIAVAGTEYQRRLGIKDSEELYFDDVMCFGEYAKIPSL